MWRPVVIQTHQTYPQGAPGNGFYRNSPKYRCCCGCCHVKTGALIVAIVEALWVAFTLVNALYLLAVATEGSQTGRAVFELILALVVGVIIALLLWGWKSERHGFLIPYLIMKVLLIITLIVFTFFVMIASENDVRKVFDTTYKESDPPKKRKGFKGLVGFSLSIAMLLQMFFLVVILGCYRFFKDKARFEAANGTTAPIQQYPASGGGGYGVFAVQQPGTYPVAPPPPGAASGYPVAPPPPPSAPPMQPTLGNVPPPAYNETPIAAPMESPNKL